MYKKIRLLITFYKNYFIFSLLINVFCLRVFWLNDFSSFFAIFWGKIFTLAIAYYFIDLYKKQEYYYYQNLGISKTILWVATLAFDFVLFIFLLITIHHIR